MKGRIMRSNSHDKASTKARFSVGAAVAAAAFILPFTGGAAASAAEPVAAEPATAEPTIEEQFAALTAEDYRQGHADLQAAGIPFDVSEDGQTIVYHFDQGDFALPVPPAELTAEPGTVTPNVAVGWDGGQSYISFNNTDQVAVKRGLTGGLVGVISIISPPMGLVAGVATAMAGAYIDSRGVCPGNDELWVYFTDGPTGPAYQQVICRPVSYPGGG